MEGGLKGAGTIGRRLSTSEKVRDGTRHLLPRSDVLECEWAGREKVSGR